MVMYVYVRNRKLSINRIVMMHLIIFEIILKTLVNWKIATYVVRLRKPKRWLMNNYLFTCSFYLLYEKFNVCFVLCKSHSDHTALNITMVNKHCVMVFLFQCRNVVIQNCHSKCVLLIIRVRRAIAEIGNMNHYPLFWVSSWNTGNNCMSAELFFEEFSTRCHYSAMS